MKQEQKSKTKKKLKRPQYSELPKTFRNFDKLNLEDFAERLLKDIDIGIKDNEEVKEKDDVGNYIVKQRGEAYTISLDAGFGKGKTTFLEMFENMIKEGEVREEKEGGVKEEKEEGVKKENYSIFKLNAWTTELHDNPTFVILAEFVDFLKNEKTKGIDYKKLVGNVIHIIEPAISLVSEPAGKIIQGGRRLYKEVSEGERILLGKQELERYEQQQELVGKIKEAISAYEKQTKKKLIILIDELDRVKPDYAVRFLETVKHFFDIPGTCFLFAVNRQQVEATVKNLFGERLDFVGYYDKFFKQEFSFVDAYSEGVRGFIKKEMKSFTEKRRKDSIGKKQEEHLRSYFENDMELDRWVALYQLSGLSLRQVKGWISKTYSNYIKLLDFKNINKSKNMEKFSKYLENLKLDPPKLNSIWWQINSCDMYILDKNDRRKMCDFYLILFHTAFYIIRLEEVYGTPRLSKTETIDKRIYPLFERFCNGDIFFADDRPTMILYFYFSFRGERMLHAKLFQLARLLLIHSDRSDDIDLEQIIPNPDLLEDLRMERSKRNPVMKETIFEIKKQRILEITHAVLYNHVKNGINFSTIYQIISTPSASSE